MNGLRAELSGFSDAEIIARYQASGDEEARNAWIEELFRRHHERVVLLCLRIAGNRDDACDLAQATFVRVHRGLDSFRGDSRFSTWLYSVARSECMNFLRRARASPTSPDDERETGEIPDLDGVRPDQLLDQQSDARMVRALLNAELDETEKKVFVLHYGDEVPLDVITRLLGLTNRSGAKAYVVSARRKLARAVQRVQAAQLHLDA